MWDLEESHCARCPSDSAFGSSESKNNILGIFCPNCDIKSKSRTWSALDFVVALRTW